MNVAVQSGVGVFLEEDFHFLAAVDNLEVVTNVVMINLSRFCKSLRVDSRHNCFKNLPVSCLIVDAYQLGYFKHVRGSLLPRDAVFISLHRVKLHDPREVRRIDVGQLVVDDIVIEKFEVLICILCIFATKYNRKRFLEIVKDDVILDL